MRKIKIHWFTVYDVAAAEAGLLGFPTLQAQSCSLKFSTIHMIPNKPFRQSTTCFVLLLFTYYFKSKNKFSTEI